MTGIDCGEGGRADHFGDRLKSFDCVRGIIGRHFRSVLPEIACFALLPFWVAGRGIAYAIRLGCFWFLVIILIIAVIGRTLITKVMGDDVVRYLRLSQMVVRIILGSLSDRDSNPARD